jgi:hypothetical protein
MSSFYRPIILAALPEATWEGITVCAESGVRLADRLIAETPLLNWAVGRDQRGDLRRIGFMYELLGACRRRDLPFECQSAPNTVGNCHHIEVRSQNLTLHVTATASLGAFPKETRLRKNSRETNQPDLFKPMITGDLDRAKQWYGWIVFNADLKGRLTHLGAGLPEHEESEWLDLISIERRKKDEGSSPIEAPPPSPDQLLGFREHIRRELEREDQTDDEDS